MNESEQAQAIAEIRKRHLSIQEGIELGTMRIGMPTAIVGHNDRAALLEIVDSQAQKIAEQAKEMSAQNIELINLRYQLQTARIQAEGVRSDIICGETSYLRQYLDGHEFPWEKQ